MNASEFVRELTTSIPPESDLESSNLPPGLYESIVQDFTFGKKVNPIGAVLQEPVFVDPLIDLISSYDMGQVNIMGISLHNKVQEMNDYWIVGDLDSDPIVVTKNEGIVQIIDQNMHSHKLWECASDGGRMLDCLKILVEFVIGGLRDENIREDDQQMRRIHDSCVKAAGGARFSQFYTMILELD